MKRYIKSSSRQPNVEKYKGFYIVKDRGGDGLNVYNDHMEVEDEGFASMRDAKLFIDGLIMEDVHSSTDSSEYEYRKRLYEKRKKEFEEYGEDDNNDLLTREEKMNIAKAKLDEVTAALYTESVDISEFIGLSKDEIGNMLDELPVGTIITGITGRRKQYDFDTTFRKDSAYESNYHQSASSPHDWKYKKEYWTVEGYEDPYIVSKIYEIANDQNKYYIMRQSVNSSCDITADYCENCEWVELASKQIPDSDGFLTDYTLYTDGENFICMFGDKDLYEPSYDYADFDTGHEEDAWEWFNSYIGFEDDGEDIWSAKRNDPKLKNSSITADEAEDDIEDLTLVDQEYDSAKTSINSKNLPAVYNMISLPASSVGVDFGGGKFDNAVEYLANQDITLYVYDPYNRSTEHNREVLKALKANGGADFAINSNVLNVIKEPEARRNVLENIKKITKPGAPIYITVYEGSGRGNEGATKSGYQLNRKTADYLEEIQEVFPDANRKGKLITAINSSTDITSAVIDGRYVTIDEVIDHVSTLVFGAADRYFHDIGYDIDYAYYDIAQYDHSRIKIEIRTEMEYEELEELAEALNPVVEDLDNDSYFEPVTYGIIEAYVSIRKVALCMGYKYTPSSNLDASTKIESGWDDIPEPSLDPPEYDEGNEVGTEADCDFEAINIKVTVDENGGWEYETIEFLNPYRGKVWTSDEYDVEIGDASDIIEDFDELVEPYIPGAAGVYYMNGKGDLMYNISGIRVVTTDGWFDERSGWEYDEEVYKDDVDIDFDKDRSSIDVIFTESPIIK